MKGSITVISVVLMALLMFTGCSKGSTESASTTATAASGSKVSITLLNSKGEIQTGL